MRDPDGRISGVRDDPICFLQRVGRVAPPISPFTPIGVDVWLDGERTTAITVRFPFPVVRVEIDPDGNFPDTDRTNNVWTRD